MEVGTRERVDVLVKQNTVRLLKGDEVHQISSTGFRVLGFATASVAAFP